MSLPGDVPYNNMRRSLLKQGIAQQRTVWRGGGSPMAAHLPNGAKVYLYPKKYMAMAMGLSWGALRRLEGRGLFPATCFRDEFGSRIYSLEQIRAANILYDKHSRLMQERGEPKGKVATMSQGFIDELQAAFAELEKTYKGEKSAEETIEAIGINPFPRFDKFPEKRGVHDMRGSRQGERK
jgi:hypothetical protein